MADLPTSDRAGDTVNSETFFPDGLECLRPENAAADTSVPARSPLPPSSPHFLDGLSDVEGAELLDALYAPLLALDGVFPAGEEPSEQISQSAATQCDEPDLPAASEVADRAKAASSASAAKRKRPRRSNPNKAREEQRMEVVFLRRKVGEMEQQLELLRAKSLQGSPTLSSKDSLGDNSAIEPRRTSLKLTDAWKQLCLHQLKRRVRAERENQRLKRALASQLQLSTSIQRLLDRPAGLSGSDLLPRHRGEFVGVPPTDPAVDRAIFAELIARADTAFGEIRGVLEANGILTADTARRGATVRQRNGSALLDVFATSVLPFDFQLAGNGVWKHYRGVGKHFGSVYEKAAEFLGSSKTTVMENFAMEILSATTRADFRVRQVVKRYLSQDRVVIVWAADNQPIEYLNKSMDFGFRETGYVVCRPPHEPTEGPAPVATVLQVCTLITPYMLSRDGSLDAELDDISQFVFSSLDMEMRANRERIENLLLNETTAR